MSDPDRATVLDQSRPNSARIHTAILGGKDYYTADHVIAEKLTRSKIGPAITESRRFALRAVGYLIDHHQVTQFVELGCGFPHTPNIGDIAADRNYTARTLYIDNDPIAATHARALMTGHTTHTAEIDLTDTTAVLDAITTALDTTAPIALCLSGTAELIEDAPAMIAALTHALPTGTWLVFTHITADMHGKHIDAATETLRAAGIAYHPRTHNDIASMLTGYQLHTPGLIAPHRWRPELICPGRYDHAIEPLHAAVWDLSAYAAIGQRCRT
ncbi:SAM-dependent methyltransferase [Nocardia sp. NBC_01730]|uniref:SAM-dependent methyltransferase n=1 Tax=Nocardia sp. NBC_01730 TaxID=2975998 RepID=UPI002E13BC69|nr:SAM-dependent methyltransferase [Nocardia sp. NBC_01730]